MYSYQNDRFENARNSVNLDMHRERAYLCSKNKTTLKLIAKCDLSRKSKRRSNVEGSNGANCKVIVELTVNDGN